MRRYRFFICNGCYTLNLFPCVFCFSAWRPLSPCYIKDNYDNVEQQFCGKILSEFVCVVSCLLKTTTTSFLPDYPMLHNGIMSVKRCAVRHVHLPSYFVFFAILIYLCCPCSLTPFIVILLFDVVLLNYLHICMMRHNFLLLSEFRFV